MNERLTVSQILVLTAYAIGMSCGQLLFKIAAMRPAIAHGTAVERLLGLLQNIPFFWHCCSTPGSQFCGFGS